MKQTTILMMLVFIMHQGISQNVGIGTNNPQEKLEVNGKLKIDTLPITGSPAFVLTTNANGIITKTPKDSLSISTKSDTGSLTISVQYGESVLAGEVVSIGDGRTGYLGASYNIYSLPGNSYNESTSRTKWLAQKFRTSGSVAGVRAILAEPFSSSNSIGVYKVLIKSNQGGVPGPSIIGATYLTNPNPSNSGGAISVLFVFDPPVAVQPNTDYHAVFIAYDTTSGNGSITAINSDVIPNSYMCTSTNSGLTWTQVPGKDCFVRIYETQTIEGRAYRSINSDPNTVIGPGSVTTLTATPYSNFTDKGNAVLGIAKESGVIGETKKVTISGIADIPNGNLSIGTYYSVGWTAGQLGTGAARVGMGIGSTKLLVTH